MNQKRGMKYIVSFDGSKIFYRIKRGTKEFIVLLHGLSSNNSILRKEGIFFREKGYSTLNLDLRGHGFSENKLQTLNLEDFARDIELILRKEKINKANFVGYSMGGFVALKLYSMFPKKIKRIAVIDSSYAINLFTLRLFFIFVVYPICVLIHLKVALFNKTPIKNMDFSKEHIKDIFLVHKCAEATLNSTNWRSIKAMLKENLKSIIKKIKIPVIIIENKQDDVFSKRSYNTLHKNIKKSILKLERGHHDSILVTPTVIEDDILEFIER